MSKPQTIYLKDYQAPAFLVEHVSLSFKLEPTSTEVVSKVKYRRNPVANKKASLRLDGEHMQLVSVLLNDNLLSASDYACSDEALIITDVPDTFTLTITTIINPEANTSLDGLYRTSGNYCSQCEAQGFRRITYFQDRPDVMTTFDVRIEADKTSNPIMLSNGNPTGAGELDNGRHWATWSDPFAKPCYLFALVSGDLACVQDTFRTQSGRDVTLKIFTEAHHIHQCSHAMASLKRAMTWDEQRFGLEYDLDLFMIVAVDDFNMGAMENKGLNVFNSRLVFASPETATDDDYISIEAVIGHEYFHNWTGNRVTCRDWFQLSLKEGLTVFRDQEFTADTHSRAVKRIEDVRMLRTHQFAEDASPMAHPIRPDNFMKINNFYTVTVYEKGAEVVRLYQSLLGIKGFRKGMDLYFQRHDGQAVTTEDFLAAMADANNQDLSQMQHWYNQAGTPKLAVSLTYDEAAQTATLHCQQTCPTTPDGKAKQPFLIPMGLGLLLPDGSEASLQLKHEGAARGSNRALFITEAEQSFTFQGVTQKPVPSLLRSFSAPVEIEYAYTLDELAFLMQHDTDSFNRWAAAQELAKQTMLQMIQANTSPQPCLLTAFQVLLNDDSLEDALKAEALMLPSENEMAEACQVVNPQKIHQAHEDLVRFIANGLRDDLKAAYTQRTHTSGLSDDAMQQRKLKNVCLGYLVALEEQDFINMAATQFASADNMTDQFAALASLANVECPERNQTLKVFEESWSDESGVMDKWFMVQASCTLPDSLSNVEALMKHDKFSIKNPNKVRALINSFALRNPSVFHAEDGSGYDFVAEQVLTLDKLNPQIASRLVRALMQWKRLEPKRSSCMKAQLERIASSKGISGDVYEIVSKSLQ
ncbi:MAG: aminopeptidase N [Ghiorsea sp.]